MIEQIVEKLAHRPDVVRVAVSDREGLLIAAQSGAGEAGTAADPTVTDDLWNAYIAQFASNVSLHLKNLTISQPREMVIHASADDLLLVWLHVGWLIARVSPSADWPSLMDAVRGIQQEFDALTG